MLERYAAEVLDRLASGHRRLAVAVSGGADSMALALLAARWAKKKRIPLTCLTVNHGLRKEAAAETRQVARWLKSRGIAHEILDYEGEKPTSNIMAEARSIRYQLLFGWCRDKKAGLLVAHNLEDQAETFLLRLQRGSGVSGLACMPESALRYGIPVMRPLLAVSRSHLEAYLKQEGQRWIEDPTNADPRYARNSLRMALASNPHTRAELSQRIFETARSMGRARHALELQVNERLQSLVEEPLPSICRLALAGYRLLPEEVALRLLEQLLSYTGQQEGKARFESLLPLHQALNGKSAGKRTLSGCVISYAKGEALFCREPAKLPPPLPLLGTTRWDDRFVFSTKTAQKQLVIRGLVTKEPVEAADSTLGALPNHALRSLPYVWGKDRKGVELPLWWPHMKKSAAVAGRLGFTFAYKPARSLGISPFAYCRAPVYHVV